MLALGASACGTSQSGLVTHSSSVPSMSICPPTTVGPPGVPPSYEVCGSGHSVQVPYTPPMPATQPCPPATTVVSQSTVSSSNERLQEGWATPGYDPGSPALGTFRVDPAPPSAAPRRSAHEAIAIAATTGNVSANTSGTRTVARFGLFTGNLVIVGTDANHTLQGARRVSGVPAWLVVTDGVEVVNFGGGAPPLPPGVSAPSVAPCPSAARGAQATVIGDADGNELANLSGGDFTPLK